MADRAANGVPEAWIAELYEFLRIPSISADDQHREDLRSAARWVANFVDSVGGEASVLDHEGAPPLVLGRIAASAQSAEVRTVILYGHYDVQPPGRREDWDSPPFDPEIRDGWLYARGATDDKGNLFALLKAVELMSAEGTLPVDVIVLADGEEEILGTTVCDFLAAEDLSADACLVFDAPMASRDLPVLITGSRGMVYLDVKVETSRGPLHSGLYGGAAMNAMHVLMASLQAVIDADSEFAAGVAAPGPEEEAAWDRLESGTQALARVGAVPADSDASEEFYRRTLARPSINVTAVSCESTGAQANVIPAQARAHLSLRLAAGQAAGDLVPLLEGVLRDAAPQGARFTVNVLSAVDSGTVVTDSETMRSVQEAFQRALGVTPPLVRTGGSLPIVQTLEQLGIPLVLTGFAPPEAGVHSVNERFLVEHLGSGVSLAMELLMVLSGGEVGRSSAPGSSPGETA